MAVVAQPLPDDYGDVVQHYPCEHVLGNQRFGNNSFFVSYKSAVHAIHLEGLMAKEIPIR